LPLFQSLPCPFRHYRPMRCQERKIEPGEELVHILRQGSVCWLSMVDQGKPYVVPVCYGYAQNALYIHSAPKGRKIDILGRSPDVCFSVVAHSEMVKADKPCSWTVRFSSVTGFGKAKILLDRKEKEEGLVILLAHCSGREYDFSGLPLDDLVVIKVEIEKMEGKRSPAGGC